jgi:hypothetical protein
VQFQRTNGWQISREQVQDVGIKSQSKKSPCHCGNTDPYKEASAQGTTSSFSPVLGFEICQPVELVSMVQGFETF